MHNFNSAEKPDTFMDNIQGHFFFFMQVDPQRVYFYMIACKSNLNLNFCIFSCNDGYISWNIFIQRTANGKKTSKKYNCLVVLIIYLFVSMKKIGFKKECLWEPDRCLTYYHKSVSNLSTSARKDSCQLMPFINQMFPLKNK